MENEIIGYKAFTKDLKALYHDFQYEIGKTYEINEKPHLGVSGFHYTSDIGYALLSYEYIDNYRLCKVRILGDIDGTAYQFSTNKIEILEEMPTISKEDNIKFKYVY